MASEPQAALLQFAIQVRAARAILNWSQRELADKVTMTQRSIYRIERGDSDIRRSTMVALETLFRDHGITFREADDGTLSINVAPNVVRFDGEAPTAN